MHRFHSRREAHSHEWRGHSGRDFARAFASHAMGGRARHGRRERRFGQGDLRYVLLQLIADKPSHGYELIKEIEDRFGGAYSPSPGVVYPTLTLLEELGHIRGLQSEGPRKAFEITDEGRAVLAQNKPTVEDIFRRMKETAERLGAQPPHQIVRAMENLRLALRL
ncbi:MAG: PadR family transcriptional regulator, partial [Caulobacteraceae bacterium]